MHSVLTAPRAFFRIPGLHNAAVAGPCWGDKKAGFPCHAGS